MREGIERGEMQLGTWVTMLRNPAVLMLLQSAGLDFARIDIEHTSMSIETVGDMATMARAMHFPIAVRPPVANREWLTRLLDIGVWNLHCPQVESAAHAAEIVAASRYAPHGRRGNGGMSAATEFETEGTLAERRAFANRQVFVTVMLETADAFKDWTPSPRWTASMRSRLGRLILRRISVCSTRRTGSAFWMKSAISSSPRRASTARPARCWSQAPSRLGNGSRPAC